MAHAQTGIEFNGLRDLAKALKEIDLGLFEELKGDLEDVGNIVRDEAARLFVAYGRERGREHSFAVSASSFETRVRTQSAAGVVVVGQGRRKSTNTSRNRSNWGGLEMTKGLLPGRERGIKEAERVLEQGAVRLLRNNGFA